MKNGKLMKVLIASTLALAVVQPVSVFAEDSETVYSSSDGSWETVNQNSWRFRLKNGKVATQWFKVGSSWYYGDPATGDTRSGWFAGDSTHWYYFNPNNGMLQYGGTRSDVGGNGWLELDGKYYYIEQEGDYAGSMIRNEAVIDGYKHYFASSGEWIRKGEKVDTKGDWKFIDGNYYYYKDGKKQYGWLELNGKKWYLDKSDGRMVHTTTRVIDGVRYEFARNGEVTKETKVEDTSEDYGKQFDASEYREEKKEVMDEFNDIRYDEEINDLRLLTGDALDKVAYIRAHELADDFDTDELNTEHFTNLLKKEKVNFQYVKEYAVKAKSSAEAAKALLEDKWLKKDLMDPTYRSVAIGVAESGSSYVWSVIITDGKMDSELSEYDPDEYDLEKLLLADCINDYRDDHNKKELDLAYDDELDQAAYQRALEISEQAGSRRPSGDSFETVLDDYGIEYDNVWELQFSNVRNYEDIFATWESGRVDSMMMLDSNFKNMGIGIAKVNGIEYVVVLLTDGDSSAGGSTTTTYRTEKNKIRDLINEEREDYYEISKLTLKTTGAIQKAADKRAKEVYDDSDDKSIKDFLKAQGISCTYAYEYSTEGKDATDVAEDIIDDFRYIDDENVKNMVLGTYKRGTKLYWTVIFYK